MGRESKYLTFFIVFDLYPQSDLLHFRDSICRSIFLDNYNKEILKTIFFKAAYCRNKLKRMIHYHRWKKAKNAGITMDLYKNPLNALFPHQKIYIIQNKTKFSFRLSDILTMWVNAISHSDIFFSCPLPLTNPYTANAFKRNNLYNIYFALFNSSYHIPPLIASLFLLEFNLKEFKIANYSALQDIAIHNYYKDVSDDEKFMDILEMLNHYGSMDHDLTVNISIKRKEWVINKIGSLLLSYYYVEYSNNVLLKEKNKTLLLKKISSFFLHYPRGQANIFMIS